MVTKATRKWLRPFGKSSSHSKSEQQKGLQGATMCKGERGQLGSEAESSVASTVSASSRISEPAEQFGYEEAPPDLAVQDNDISMYGYGDATPDSYQGTGIAKLSLCVSSAALPRRKQQRTSSLKQPEAPRRESIQLVGEIEIELPVTKQKVKRRTSISFKDEVSVETVDPVPTMVEKPQDLWFQQNEYSRIRKKSIALTERAGADGTVDGKKYCLRGLERMRTPHILSVKRGQAWDVVLNEQYLQREEGGFDEEHMANLYRVSTLRSQAEAARLASKDAEEAEMYLRDTRRNMRRRCSM